MTIRQDPAEAMVRTRPAGPLWIAFFGLGAAIIVAAATTDGGLLVTLLELAVGAFNLAVGLALRIIGVDLRSEFVVVRNVRRRSVPWPEVQAVISHDDSGNASVSLIFDNDGPLTLAYPPGGPKGNAECERDFQRINEWSRRRVPRPCRSVFGQGGIPTAPMAAAAVADADRHPGRADRLGQAGLHRRGGSLH